MDAETEALGGRRVEDLKVSELKAELKRYGLPMTGLKSVLADRLKDHFKLLAEQAQPKQLFTDMETEGSAEGKEPARAATAEGENTAERSKSTKEKELQATQVGDSVKVGDPQHSGEAAAASSTHAGNRSGSDESAAAKPTGKPSTEEALAAGAAVVDLLPGKRKDSGLVASEGNGVSGVGLLSADAVQMTVAAAVGPESEPAASAGDGDAAPLARDDDEKEGGAKQVEKMEEDGGDEGKAAEKRLEEGEKGEDAIRLEEERAAKGAEEVAGEQKEEEGGEGEEGREDEEGGMATELTMEADGDLVGLMAEADEAAKEDEKQTQGSKKRASEGDAAKPAEAGGKKQRRWSGSSAKAETNAAAGSSNSHVGQKAAPAAPSAPSAAAAPPATAAVAVAGAAHVVASGPTPASAATNAELDRRSKIPAPSEPISNSLRIDNFVRPFTQKQVQDLLAQTGKVEKYWMDNIRTHCYVAFSSEDEARATREALYGLVWPTRGGKQLTARFVSYDEVVAKVENRPIPKPEPPAAAAAGAGASLIASPGSVPPSRGKAAPVAEAGERKEDGGNGPKEEKDGEDAGIQTGDATSNGVKKEEQEPKKQEEPTEPELPTLDDLFKKTKTKPHIYFLPLTDEQVAAKLAAQKSHTPTVRNRA